MVGPFVHGAVAGWRGQARTGSRSTELSVGRLTRPEPVQRPRG